MDEPEAKASLIWIIGEYANKIDNADELLGIFVDSFTEESYAVSTIELVRDAELIRRFIGPIANVNSSGEIVPKETRFITRSGAARP